MIITRAQTREQVGVVLFYTCPAQSHTPNEGYEVEVTPATVTLKAEGRSRDHSISSFRLLNHGFGGFV